MDKYIPMMNMNSHEIVLLNMVKNLYYSLYADYLLFHLENNIQLVVVEHLIQ
jgi:hypothetical protein